MIEKELLEWISRDKDISKIDLIEKDLILQGILIRLSKSDYFKRHYAFKGGTCLTKVYFGYYRFSEDLDFTWMPQGRFEKLSRSQVSTKLAIEVNTLLALFESISKEMELDFKPQKSNKEYVELSVGNRFATFKFKYLPALSDMESFVKIQINFVEKIFFSPKIMSIKPLYANGSHELSVLYPIHAEWAITRTELFVYDVREIASEKIRAILTRRGTKVRDYIDLQILNNNAVKISTVIELAMEKTLFMLRYEKYEQNLFNKKFDEKIELGAEKNLLIQKPYNNFPEFTEKVKILLKDAAEKIKEEYLKQQK